MLLRRLIAGVWFVLVCVVASAHAEKRVALVVGNAAYRHADKLDNPVNDAQGMRGALGSLGSRSSMAKTSTLKGLGRAIGQFADRVEDAEVAIVYFAGHGSTFDGTSYVVPVDAEFASLGEVSHELIPVETLIGDLRRAKGVRIAILDACRDNGSEQRLKRLVTRGGEGTRGLAPMKNVSGLIIAYATQYGATAADIGTAPGGLLSWTRSSVGHSPFSAALLNNIATPGVDVKEMFYKVGRDVIAATDGRQRPEISISMYDQYALTPTVENSPLALPTDRPAGGVPTTPSTPPVGLPRSAASGPGEPTLLAIFGEWGAYTATPEGKKVCFALAKPVTSSTVPPDRPRDPAWMFISSRPAEKVTNEVSVTFGFIAKPNADATMELAGASYALNTQGDGARVKNPAEEPNLVAVLQKGGDVSVKGTSANGVAFTDVYSLKGFTQALDKIARECRG